MTQSDSVLKTLLKSIKELAQSHKEHRAPKVACVFDLDSTLFCVSTRTQAILRELALEEGFHSQFKQHAELLKEITVHPTDWGTKQALMRLGVSFPQMAIHQIRDYWRKNFFSNEYLKHDELYESSNLFVQLCEQLQCEIFYLTGRSQHLMREGSLKQLKEFSFPLARPEHLIMKAKEDEQDEDFKLNKLIEIERDFDHVYFFENEPVIVDSVIKNLPQVKVIFMDSTHSARKPTPEGLPTITPHSFKSIKDFE